MTHIRLEQKRCYNWEGYCLTNGDIELGITPDIGGRIISLKVQGEELFYADKNRMGETFDFDNIDHLASFKRNFGFRLWGGDKTWVAPEKNWVEGIPPLHLDAGKYKIDLLSDSIRMISPIDQETGLQIIRQVTLQETGCVELYQCFINQGEKPITCGIWNVTQLQHPFCIYFPIRKKELKPDLRFVASVRDKDTLVNQIYEDWLRICCIKPLQFKCGCNIFEGKIAALREYPTYTIGMLRYFSVDPYAKYPHDDMVEVYNSDRYPYLELEILSPLVSIQPHDQITHRQVWWIKKISKKTELPAVLHELHN